MTKAIVTSEDHRAIGDLLTMLSYCSPHGSKMDKSFVNRFLRPLGIERDAAGNVFKRVGESDVVWSSHTDTVHYKSGMQDVAVSGDYIKLRSGSKSNCLGADCTTGVWLMVEMIRANVPGLYIFHYGEESGGIGSRFIRDKTPELVKGKRFAIAFDRMRTTSIITRQAGGRCCSDAFAASLSAALDGSFEKDTGGTFTDTANYTGLIGECTNLSVGYENQHSSRERQDWRFALKLRKMLLAFDESKLVSKRKPGEADPLSYGAAQGWERWRTSRSLVPQRTLMDEVESDHMWGRNATGRTLAEVWNGAGLRRFDRNVTKLERLIRENPAAVADYLDRLGEDAEDMAEAILAEQGYVNR